MTLRSLSQKQCLAAGFLMGANAMGVAFNAFRAEWLNTAICSLLLVAVAVGLLRTASVQARAQA